MKNTKRIDLKSDQEMNRVCQRLKCSRIQLQFCLNVVGNDVEEVEKYWNYNKVRLKYLTETPL